MNELCYLGVKIPEHLETEIKSLVEAKRYKNKTDVVITALRLLLSHEKPIIEAKNNIQ